MLLRRLIGSALRRARLRQGRTLREVAQTARVSMPYLSEVERGRKEVSSEILAAICVALGLHLSDLLDEIRGDLAVLPTRPSPVGPSSGPGVRPAPRAGSSTPGGRMSPTGPAAPTAPGQPTAPRLPVASISRRYCAPGRRMHRRLPVRHGQRTRHVLVHAPASRTEQVPNPGSGLIGQRLARLELAGPSRLSGFSLTTGPRASW